MTLHPSEQPGASGIALLVSDIDGTLVTPSKALTTGARAAVRRLEAAGVGFTLVSSRPPRGMAALVAELAVRLPFGAFNGGSLVAPDLSLLSSLHLSREVSRRVLALLEARDIGVWVFAGGDWLARDARGAEVACERRAIGFGPKVVEEFGDSLDRIDKIAVISADDRLLARIQAEAQALVGDAAAIRLSQPGHLDVTHPKADKGEAVSALSARIGVDLRRVAVIGDMFNDAPMFARAGYSVAMGQGPEQVRAQADAVTLSNSDDGFAHAVDRFILPPGRGQGVLKCPDPRSSRRRSSPRTSRGWARR
jgi:Cof subfamily protein (haloacid dehalogenase superfamily)